MKYLRHIIYKKLLQKVQNVISMTFHYVIIYDKLKNKEKCMKKIALSVVAIVGMSSFGFAGGDIAPVAEPVVVVEEVDNSSFYLGLGLTAVSTRDSSVDLNFFDAEYGQDRLGNVSLIAGYNFNEYIAVEGRYTTAISEEDLVEMDGWSLFVKPQYPVSEDFSVYALLGFGAVTMDGVNDAAVDVDDSGFQWGIGASYLATENISVFIDYTSLATDMEGLYWDGALEVDADAVTIGVNYLF